MNETATLAKYATEVIQGDIPPEVIDYAKILLLDQVGCQLAGSVLPWTQPVYESASTWSAPGGATVVGKHVRLMPDSAAFINSAFGHGHESDDSHSAAPNHPGSVIIPAALAAAEDRQCSGARALEAIVVGYEVMERVSMATSPWLVRQGHHPPLATGPFGAAAAVGHVLGLSQEEMVSALGIAGSICGGTAEYSQSGGSVKRIHCAIPAQGGTRAALLAKAGMTGPKAILEGRKGFCRVFSPEADLTWLDRELGERFLISETGIKIHSCNGATGRVLEGLRKMRLREDVGVDQVENIEVFAGDESRRAAIGTIRYPSDALGAQFSTAFCVGLYLTRGHCHISDFDDAAFADSAILDIAKIVEVKTRPGMRRQDVAVYVYLKDGRVLEEEVTSVKGGPENPLSREEATAKYMSAAVPVLGSEQLASECAELVFSIDDQPDAGALLKRLAKKEA